MDNLISPNKNGIWRHRLALASGLSGIHARRLLRRSEHRRITLEGANAQRLVIIRTRVSATTNSEAKATSPSEEENAVCDHGLLRRHSGPHAPSARKGSPMTLLVRASSRPTRRGGSLLSAAKGLGKSIDRRMRPQRRREESPRGGLERQFHVRAQIKLRNRGAKNGCAAGPAGGPVSHVSERPLARTGLSPATRRRSKPEEVCELGARRHETHRNVRGRTRGHARPQGGNLRRHVRTALQSMGGPDFVQTASGFTGYNSSLGGDPANAGTLWPTCTKP